MSTALLGPVSRPTTGSVIAGRWRLDEALGVGGMAEVFRAEDLTTGRKVAVKLLLPEIAANPEAVERTKREGAVLSSLRNPAIVAVETFGELEDGTVFVVMELLEGETLGDRMRRGPMDPSELVPIVAGTCAGLYAAHSRGIIHRDLKPDNIFLCPTEHGVQVKLLDFGISKVYGQKRLSFTGQVLGTPRYMSPEQLSAEDVDARVDVYSLGVILYEAIAGKPPFLAPSSADLIVAILNGKAVPLSSARPGMSPAVERVVMCAISKQRTARFETAMALGEAYIDAVGGAPQGAQRDRRTRAMGGILTASAEASQKSDDVAGSLKLGTFSGFESPLASAAPPETIEQNKYTAPIASIERSEAEPRVAIDRGGFGGSPPRMIEMPERSDVERTAAPRIEPNARTGAMDEPTAAQADAIPSEAAPAEPIAAADLPKTRVAQARPLLETRETPRKVPDPDATDRNVPPTALMDASQTGTTRAPRAEPPRRARKRRGTKIVLIAGALLAGAASATAVIAALHFYDQHRPEEPVPPVIVRDRPPRVVHVEPTPTPPVVAPVVAPPETIAPVPVDPPPSRQHGARHPREAPPEQIEENPTGTPRIPIIDDILGEPPPEENEPPDPLREAARALSGGDPARCIDILDQAIRQGAPPMALRRRGDCLEAAGQRDAAIGNYQRFCRLVPDHPSIEEVRSILAGWGQTCP